MSGVLNQTMSNVLTSKELGDSETEMTGQNGHFSEEITSLKAQISLLKAINSL